MIVIHNFKEAHHLYQQGLLPFRLLQEQARVLIDLCPQPGRYIDVALDITEADIEWMQQSEVAYEDYNGMLGGEIYVCQSVVDLKAVVGMDMAFARTHGNRWPDVTDQVMSWDQCDFLPESSGDPQWAVFLLCWNDAGGNVFYIPQSLWAAAKVAEHVAETQRHWG